MESGKAQLEPLQQHLQDSQQEINAMQMKLMEMKDLENHNNQLNWCSSPHSVLVNGTTDYCSLSTSSSETANLNEHAECQSNLESEPIHQESPARSSPEIPPSVVTDENAVVAAAVTEKVCPEFDNERHSKEEDPFNAESSSLTDPVADTNLDFSSLILLLAVILSRMILLEKLIHLVVIPLEVLIHLHLTASSSNLLLILLPLQVLTLSVQPATAVIHR